MEKGRTARRPLALILSVFMILTMLSGVSFAAEENGFSPEFETDSGIPAEPKTDSYRLDSNAGQMISKWEWIDEKDALFWDAERSVDVLVIAASADNPADKDEVLDLLPKELAATMADSSERTIQLVWDETMLDSIDGRAWSGDYVLQAMPMEGFLGEGVRYPFALLILDSPALLTATDADLVNHTVEGINPPNTVVNLFDYDVSDYVYTYESGKPAVSDNLTDLLAKNHTHWTALNWTNASGNAAAAEPSFINYGINTNHLLLFGDGICHAGLWNRGAGQGAPYGMKYAGMEKIVKANLVNGYPVINLDLAKETLIPERAADVNQIRYFDTVGECSGSSGNGTSGNYPNSDGNQYPNISDTLLKQWHGDISTEGEESLNYLFDPDLPHDNPDPNDTDTRKYGGKEAYKDVTGLFQLDQNGYYYYNMRENYAEFDAGKNAFILYDAPATIRTDGTNSIGNFFPFNKGIDVFSPALSDDAPLRDGGKGAGTGKINHYLGMTVETTFRQPLNGQINSGANIHNMTFEFSGDDDVWVFVDDVLVLDIGGVHSELYGTIDFATGEVLVGRAFNTHGIPTKEQIEEDLANPDPTGGPSPVIKTTLYNQFAEAGAVDPDEKNPRGWRVEADGTIRTFASNTSHTLKMFYLERGNYDSSLALRFNLQPLLYQQIRKVDQNGQPLEGVEFELYPAELVSDEEAQTITEEDLQAGRYIACSNKNGITVDAGPYYVKETKTNGQSTVLTVVTTDEDGMANFTDPNAHITADESGREAEIPPFNFSDRYDAETGAGTYYILRETMVPDGYRKPPLDIALEFDPDVTMLTVANRWTTGAYASFADNVLGTSDITYGHFVEAGNPGAGTIESSDEKPVALSEQQNGLIVAVPMVKSINEDSLWNAVYGDNVNGFSTVETGAVSASKWREAVLKAALYQCASSTAENSDTPPWLLEWNAEEGRLAGRLEDLPGVASRYELNNRDDPDLRMVFGIITTEAFGTGGLNLGSFPPGAESAASQRYKALGAYIRRKAAESTLENAIQETAARILSVDDSNTGSGKAFSFLNVDQFNRSFRSIIYIPNEQRELRVRKIDQNNQPVEGAEFTIYANANLTEVQSVGYTDADGNLVFAPYCENNVPGEAEMVWISDNENDLNTNYGRTYYLKETATPKGKNYQINPAIIPIKVGYYSIYADAGTPENGVSVMAGVGKLNQTMKKYAQDKDINITLRDITAFAQVQPSDHFDLYSWQDLNLDGTEVKRSMNLHYGVNAVVDYGLHDEDGGDVVQPFFTTNTGFIRARVQQNSEDGQGTYEEDAQRGNWDDLGNIDLTNIFSLLNVVVVTDENLDVQQGSLRLSKRVTGDGLTEADHTKNFSFVIRLYNADGQEYPAEKAFNFYGTNKSGILRSGDQFPLHHDEEIVICGLPYGTRYQITELREDDTKQDFPYVTPQDGIAEGQITEDEPDVSAPFINHKDPLASFTIRKTVTGGAGETDKDFHFTVTLRDENGVELPYWYPYSGSKAGGVRSGETITLRHNQSVTIEGLPAGTTYEVAEMDAGQNGYTTTITGETGKLTIGESPVASFVNRRDAAPPTAALTIRKTVTGSGVEQDRSFHFTITLKDEMGRELLDSYHYTGSETGVIKSGGTIPLRHGQSVIIEGLPIGTNYTVTEREANQDGYTTSVSGASGSITSDETSIAAFVNHRNDDDEDNEDNEDDDEDDDEDGDNDNTDDSDNNDDSVSDDNNSGNDDPPKDSKTPRDSQSPDTGDITETGKWVALALAFLAGAAGILLSRRNKRKN